MHISTGTCRWRRAQRSAFTSRQPIDAGYKTLGKTGDIHTTFKEWQTVFGNMDRRSLYAVASNEGGQFTAEEQGAANSFMIDQEEKVMGLQPGMSLQNPAAADRALIGFLDNVSPEEKSSFQ